MASRLTMHARRADRVTDTRISVVGIPFLARVPSNDQMSEMVFYVLIHE